MNVATLLMHLCRQWQIERAIRALDSPQEEARARATAALAVSPACRPALRRTAFRQRSLRAILAAELLYNMGDAQGLYALLEQFAAWEMSTRYQWLLRGILHRIGHERILAVLESSLERIETPPLPPNHWSLSLSVYALNALCELLLPVPRPMWQRAITAFAPDRDDLHLCRTALPSLLLPPEKLAYLPPLDEWRVGSSLVAVRRIAIDCLLVLEPAGAFDLLAEALAVPEPQVQLTAIYGFCRLRDPRALALLQPIAATRRHPLCRDARHAVEALGSEFPDARLLVRASDRPATFDTELLHPTSLQNTCDPSTLVRPSAIE